MLGLILVETFRASTPVMSAKKEQLAYWGAAPAMGGSAFVVASMFGSVLPDWAVNDHAKLPTVVGGPIE